MAIVNVGSTLCLCLSVGCWYSVFVGLGIKTCCGKVLCEAVFRVGCGVCVL